MQRTHLFWAEAESMARFTAQAALRYSESAGRSSAELEVCLREKPSSLAAAGYVRHVIHTVGPIHRDGAHGEAEQLASCHRESIQLADQHALQSLSFPAISTGAYGYPVAQAAPIAISSSIEALAAAKHVSMVRFVLFDTATLRAYMRAAEELKISELPSSYEIEKGP